MNCMYIEKQDNNTADPFKKFQQTIHTIAIPYIHSVPHFNHNVLRFHFL